MNSLSNFIFQAIQLAPQISYTNKYPDKPRCELTKTQKNAREIA